MIIVLILIGDGLFVAVTLATGLVDVRRDLIEGAELLAADDPAASVRAFRRAGQGVDEAIDRFNHPSAWLAKHVPLLGTNVRAVESATRAAQVAAEAGAGLADSIRQQTPSGSTLAENIYSDGRVRFEVVRELTSPVVGAADSLRRAQRLVVDAPQPNIAPLRKQMFRIERQLDDAVAAADRAVTALRVLPALLAEGDGRRYLLAFQSPSEARGGGGFIGLLGVIDVRDGRLDLKTVQPPPHELVDPASEIQPVAAPSWMVDHYGRSVATNSSDSNLSAHFPSTAPLLARLYRQVTGTPVDGVIAMDPIAMEHLLPATGPIEATRELPRITSDNVVEVVLHDSYRTLEGEQQNEALRAVMETFWDRVTRGQLDARLFISGLGDAAVGGHLRVYAFDRTTQSALGNLSVAGDFTTEGPHVQTVFHNSESVSKIDYFFDRTVETIVQLNVDGSADVTTNVVMKNNAPRDAERSLIYGGLGPGYTPGENRLALNVVLPVNATIQETSAFGDAVDFEVGNEAGYPVVSRRFIISGGGSATASLTYRIPDAVEDAEDGHFFELTLFPHATVRPDSYLFTINAPDGHIVREQYSVDEGSYVQRTGALTAPVTLRVEVSTG